MDYQMQLVSLSVNQTRLQGEICQGQLSLYTINPILSISSFLKLFTHDSGKPGLRFYNKSLFLMQIDSFSIRKREEEQVNVIFWRIVILCHAIHNIKMTNNLLIYNIYVHSPLLQHLCHLFVLFILSRPKIINVTSILNNEYWYKNRIFHSILILI